MTNTQLLREIVNEVLSLWPNADNHQGVWTIWAEDTTKYVLVSVEGNVIVVGRYTTASDDPVHRVEVRSEATLDTMLDAAVSWAYAHEGPDPRCLTCGHLSSIHADTAEAHCCIVECSCETLHLH